MDDIVKEKIKNLIALRNNYFTMLFLLTGANVGIFFNNHSISSSIILYIGIFLMLLSLKLIRQKSDEINELLNEVKTNV